MELYYRVSLHLKDDSNDLYQLGNLKVNFKSGDVIVNNKPVSLTARELDLLIFLLITKIKFYPKNKFIQKCGAMKHSLMIIH